MTHGLTEDWAQIADLFGSGSLPLVAQRSFLGSRFLQKLVPSSEVYYSKLNPVFLMALKSPAPLLQADRWLIRDGLLPLQLFFKKFPRYERFTGDVFVHESCAAAVPAWWRKRTRFYRVRSREAAPKRVRELMMTGLASPKYCELQQFRKILEQAPHSSGTVSAFVGEEARSEYKQDLLSRFGETLVFVNKSEFQRRKNYRDAALLELNARSFIADDYMVHRVLSGGARLFEPEQNKRRGRAEYHALSPYHGYEIFEKRAWA